MLSRKTIVSVLYCVDVLSKLGVFLYSTNSFANESKIEQIQERCIMQADVKACEHWESIDPDGYSEAFPYQYHDLESLSRRWGVDVERLEKLEAKSPWLFSDKSIDSVEGFNPFSIDFANMKEFECSNLTKDQAWKWMSYRREEIAGNGQYNENMGESECFMNLERRK